MASLKDSDSAEENSASPRPEIITPLSVTPRTPGKGLPPNARGTRIKAVILAMAFVLLVSGGLWLLNYLSDLSYEIADTDSLDFRNELKAKRAVLEKIQQALGKAE